MDRVGNFYKKNPEIHPCFFGHVLMVKALPSSQFEKKSELSQSE